MREGQLYDENKSKLCGGEKELTKTKTKTKIKKKTKQDKRWKVKGRTKTRIDQYNGEQDLTERERGDQGLFSKSLSTAKYTSDVALTLL